MTLLHTVMAASVAVCLAVPAWADARLSVLMDVLQLNDVVQILRTEGQDYAASLDDQMLDGQGGDFFRQQVDRIYDPDAMAEHIRAGFAGVLSAQDVETAIAFYGSDLGQTIVSLENAARLAMIDPDVEEAARATYANLRGTEDPRLVLLQRFFNENDLLDRNVAAAMSSNLAFYNGLVDGKYFSLTPDEMLQEIWAQEDDLRAETEDWLFGYFLMAYQSLDLEELGAYVAFSTGPAGVAFNQGLFAGHEKMYREISYALGRALALSAAGSAL